MKICPRCTQLLSDDSFHKSRTRGDGLQPICIQCRKMEYNTKHKLARELRETRAAVAQSKLIAKIDATRRQAPKLALTTEQLYAIFEHMSESQERAFVSLHGIKYMDPVNLTGPYMD